MASPLSSERIARPLSRRREIAWRASHAQDFERLAGQWVVLEGETVIAHGPDPTHLVTLARERGIQSPYVFFVEPVVEGRVRIGL